MDRTMSEGMNKILYWTGVIEPQREGISKEVFMLHDHFKKSFVIGVSPDGRFDYSSTRRYFGMPHKLLPSDPNTTR